MGLLSLGTPFHWDQAKHFADHVRSHGITQFLNTWDRLKDRFGDELLWGDEVRLLLTFPPLSADSRPYRSST
jgi:glutamate--cysteine ligase catalytic subunit